MPDMSALPGVATIMVTGPVTRAEAARWREAFAGPVSQGLGLRLDLAESGPWDLAGVQLLLAAMASGRRAGLPVEFVRAPGALRSVAERAGLLDRLAAFLSGV